MIEHMRHMGNSGKLAIIAAVVALLMLVLTALTLEEPVMFTFLALVALAYVAALFEVLSRRRYAVAVATSLGTSLSIAFSLAFVSTWELAFAGQPSFFGTPLPTGDPDNYFYLTGASGLSTLLVLFLGAAWPGAKQLPTTARKRASQGRPPTAARRPAPRQGAPGQRASGQRTSGQAVSGSRTPATRVPAAAARRPSSASSASPERKPGPAASKPKPVSKAGAKTASRR